MSTEDPLLAYARRYVENLPVSALKSIAALRGPLERAVTERLGDPNWYCDKWPGRNLVTFFSWLDDRTGLTATWSVDLDDGTVTQLAKARRPAKGRAARAAPRS